MGAVAPVLEELSQSIVSHFHLLFRVPFCLLTSYECPRILKLPFETPWCCNRRARGSWSCSFDILGRGTGLETRFD